jgi:hypothetical protein
MKPKWLQRCPPARQVKAFRLSVAVGAYRVWRHDDSNGNRYWCIADDTGNLVTERGTDYWSEYREALRAARRLFLADLIGVCP